MPAEDQTKNNIEEQDWYHGYRPRKDIMRLLKEPGDFLVRASDGGGSTDIILSVSDETKKIVNLTLRFEEGRWFLAQLAKDPAKAKAKKTFGSIVELIDYYRGHPFSKKCPIKTPILRPQWLIKHDNIVFDKEKDKLGTGNFCSVFKGKYKMKGGETPTVAVKMSLHSIAADANSEEAIEARKSMIHEAQLMSLYVHDNVIRLYGVACDHPPVLVVMEFCPGGDLQSHLKKLGDGIENTERALYCFESARGMTYLHRKHCVHRDLAARNCLISEKGEIKIADFRMSKLLEDGKDDANEGMEQAQVPLRWMAPESLKKPLKYNAKTDVWSYGVMLYEIFSNGGKPWPSDPPKYIATIIRKGTMPALPEKTPPKIKEFGAKLWNMDADKRPNFHTIALFMKEQMQSLTVVPVEKMALNKIAGVKRTNLAVQDDETTEYDESSGASTDNEDKKGPTTPSRRKASRSQNQKRDDKKK